MIHLTCQTCQTQHPTHQPIWRCPCGGLLDLIATPSFDKQTITSRPPDMWRYREALPLDSDHHIISFQEGFTPLLPIEIDGRLTHIKQDHLFPTGSYKDRGAAVLLSKIKELGITEIVEDSSGNAGAAVAAYAARAGIQCHIYVPEETADAKLAQIEMYGSTLHKIPGNRQATADAVLTAAEQTYYASHSWNPYFFHGTKTFAFEVWEQLGWQAPDAVVLPAGNGTLLLGVFIGFQELLQAGEIEKLPQLIAVQAAHCVPLAAVYPDPAPPPYQLNKQAPTLAEGIAIPNPIRGRDILSAVQQTNGRFITVSETEISQTLLLLAKQGFYIEPTSAATIAGLRQFLPETTSTQTIASVFTGNGLKTTEKMLKLLETKTND